METFSFPADTISVFDAPEALTDELLSSVMWGIQKGRYSQGQYLSDESISPKTNFGFEPKYIPSTCMAWATERFNEVLDQHNFQRQRISVESWWNYYPPKSIHELHTHIADILSGIWVMSDNEDSGTVFVKESYSSLTRESINQIKIDTVKSKFIVFPSHLMHYTLPSAKDRYTAAFNCKCA